MILGFIPGDTCSPVSRGVPETAWGRWWRAGQASPGHLRRSESR